MLNNKIISRIHNKIANSVRIKLALTAIFTVCAACIFSLIAVAAWFYLFFSGTPTLTVIIISLCIVCAMTMLIAGVIVWHGAQFVTNPIIKINDGVKKISQGNFKIEIKVKGNDEVGQLAVNFNKMAKELSGMEYMSKDFMSNVSHEVKTPVAAISGFAEALLEGQLNEQQEKEYLHSLYEENQRLNKLCDNMLKMSRLDNQVLITNKKEFLLDEQLRKCIITLSDKWENKEIEFDLILEECKIINDYDLLYQVWLNLLDNAIKFSKKEGIITVRCYYDPEKCYHTVIIKDNGIGIEEDKIARIFEKFYQCDESHKREGHGLGLSIVKRIVDLTGGNIICESKKEEGTAFTISLPNI